MTAKRHASAPWAAEKRAKMCADKVADPDASPMIWLLVTLREARWLADGMVSEALAAQAEQALKERT